MLRTIWVTSWSRMLISLARENQRRMPEYLNAACGFRALLGSRVAVFTNLQYNHCNDVPRSSGRCGSPRPERKSPRESDDHRRRIRLAPGEARQRVRGHARWIERREPVY